MRFIELTFRDEAKAVVNAERINYLHTHGDGYTAVHFNDSWFIEVKETPERILKLIETAK